MCGGWCSASFFFLSPLALNDARLTFNWKLLKGNFISQLSNEECVDEKRARRTKKKKKTKRRQYCWVAAVPNCYLFFIVPCFSRDPNEAAANVAACVLLSISCRRWCVSRLLMLIICFARTFVFSLSLTMLGCHHSRFYCIRYLRVLASCENRYMSFHFECSLAVFFFNILFSASFFFHFGDCVSAETI